MFLPRPIPRVVDRSINDPEGFWTEHAQRLHWFELWHTLREWDYHKAEIGWFLGGKLNACYNCVDRHVEDGHGDDTALIWEGNDPEESRTYTYRELQAEVQRAANALKALGIGKGDRVCIYMQMIPELSIAMLACARIGASTRLSLVRSVRIVWSRASTILSAKPSSRRTPACAAPNSISR